MRSAIKPSVVFFFLCTVALRAADPRPAPAFAFTTPSSGQRAVNQLSGKVVLLAFGYSTCQPCQAQSERMKKLADEFGSRGLESYSISIDANAKVISETTTQTPGLPLSWADARAARNFLGYSPSDRFSVPQLVLLDRAGQIRYQTTLNGADPLRTQAALRAHVTELLAPPPAAPAPESRGKKNRR